MYKTYKSKTEELIILISNKNIVEWYFDYSTFDKLIEVSHCQKRFTDLQFLVKCSRDKICLSKIKIYYKSVHSIDANSEDELKAHFDVFVKDLEQLGYAKMTLEFYGRCNISEAEYVDCEIFQVMLERNNNLSLTISSKNFSLLPHNPITKQKQFELWKRNAPILANVLEQFSKFTDLSLIMEDGEYIRNGAQFCAAHPFYLKNSVINDKPNDFDEFYIPFDLLE